MPTRITRICITGMSIDMSKVRGQVDGPFITAPRRTNSMLLFNATPFANTVLMGCGFLLVSYQLSGYFIRT